MVTCNPVIMRLKMIYAADPMCPWCWGFSPVFEEVRSLYFSEFEFSYLAGGLRTGDKVREITEDAIEYIKDHWECAELETKQHFDLEFPDVMDFRYDTEPSCRAVVAFRSLWPDLVFDYEHQLQKSFYTERLNITEYPALEDVVRKMGLDPDLFSQAYSSIETEIELRNDISRAHTLEHKILPLLYIEEDGQRYYLAKGFTKKNHVMQRIQDYLNESVHSDLSDREEAVTEACNLETGECR